MIEMIETPKTMSFFAIGCSVMRRSSLPYLVAGRLNGRAHVLTTLETSVHSRYTDDDSALNDLSRSQKLAGGRLHQIAPRSTCCSLLSMIKSWSLLQTSVIPHSKRTSRQECSQIPDCERFQVDVAHVWLQEAKQHIRPSKSDPRLGNTWKSDKSEPPTFDGDACWTLSNRRMSLVKQILTTINAAKKTLRISTYAFSSLESGVGNQVLKAILAADARGVRTTILYHATSTAIGRPPREHEAHGFSAVARCKNLTMVGHPRLHAKHVIADEETALMFTANLDGSHGLNSGIEVGIKLSPTASIELSKWHDSLFNDFPLELVVEPTPPSQFERRNKDCQPAQGYNHLDK